MVKLPCGKVTVAKLPSGEVTGSLKILLVTSSISPQVWLGLGFS